MAWIPISPAMHNHFGTISIALRCRARAGFSRRSRENPTMCGLGPASRVNISSKCNTNQTHQIQHLFSVFFYKHLTPRSDGKGGRPADASANSPDLIILYALGPKQTFTTSPVKGFTSEVQLTQERNLYQKATVKQFTSEVNRPSLPSLFHHGVHFSHCSYEQ